MFDFRIEDMVPGFLLDDKNGYAMAKALEALMKAVDAAVGAGIQITQDPNSMPEWRLDELAWEYDMSWYDYRASAESKKEQISGLMDYYNRMGTPEAVKKAMEDCFGTGTLEEWFEYDGTPGHFRATTTGEAVGIDNLKKFLAILAAVKPLHTALDTVSYNGATGTARGYIGTRVTGIYGATRAEAAEAQS